MINKKERELVDFFTVYARLFNEGIAHPETAASGTAGAFAPCFIAANPVGVNCGYNGAPFLDAIRKGYEFYREIGINGAEIEAIHVNLLDEFHAMVQVRWRFFYTRKQLHEYLEFNVTYFVQVTEKGPVIFGYITGDEQKML